MHELSICASIAEIVDRCASGRVVRTIHLRIGRLRQVVPETLSYCWSIVSAGSSLDGSLLDVEDVPVRITCRSCGASTELDDLPLFLCAQCRGVDVSVVSGEEFLITALDLAEV